MDRNRPLAFNPNGITLPTNPSRNDYLTPITISINLIALDHAFPSGSNPIPGKLDLIPMGLVMPDLIALGCAIPCLRSEWIRLAPWVKVK